MEKTLDVGLDNPLVAVVFRFKDGAALRQVFKEPVTQSEAMKALGKMVAELGRELNIDLGDEEASTLQ